MAVLIPRLAVLIPLVGVTSGTLCALVYPPFFQIITFWEDWKVNFSKKCFEKLKIIFQFFFPLS